MYINDKLMVNFQEDLEKWINILNKSEMLELDFDKDGLPPMPPLGAAEEVKLEPDETIAERFNLNPRKRKVEGIRLKIKNLDSKKFIN